MTEENKMPKLWYFEYITFFYKYNMTQLNIVKPTHNNTDSSNGFVTTV